MRTDAKIGFAIGGVLLAVLTVYAIVVPRHSKKPNTTATVVVLPQTTESSTSGAQLAAVSETATPAPAPAPAPVTSAKDLVAPSPIGQAPVAAETSGASGSAAGFHPILMPKDIAKADTPKPAKLVDGAYTPEGSTPRLVARAKHTDVNLLPDDSDAASTTGDTLYTIKSGQTLSKIAYEVYGNSRFWVVIQRENKGLDANHLKVGSKIKLPDISNVVPGPVTVSDDEIALPMAAVETPRHTTPAVTTTTDAHSYTVKSGDSLYGIAKRLLGTGRKADAIYDLNKDAIGPDKSKLKLGMVLKLPAAAQAAIAD